MSLEDFTQARKNSLEEDGARSRIPRFQRSASMRLRGERRPVFGSIAENDGWLTRKPSFGKSFPFNSTPLNLSNRPGHLPVASSSPGSYPHTPTPSPEAADDLDSVKSFGSICSTMSCDYAFAKNGTTFSGRKMKYVVHCARYPENNEEYLTPTQRANKQIRKLKALLNQAKKETEQKDVEIFRLTKEVVELRLFKASLDADKTDRSERVGDECDEGCVQDKKTSYMNANGVEDTKNDQSDNSQCLPRNLKSPTHRLDSDQSGCSLLQDGSLEKINSDLPSSLADSGHFEDLTSSSVHSKESVHLHSHGVDCRLTPEEDREEERRRIVNMYEKKIEELQRNNINEYQELKEKYNDKIENLLQKLSEVNTRYCELRPEYDRAQDQIRELHKELERLRKDLEEQEEKQKNMYLKMYVKGQEAARFEHADQVLEFAHQAPNRISVPELLTQLQVTEQELEKMKDVDSLHTEKSQALLSAKEAVSLWIIGTRKAMYRRIAENRASSGEIDPEITLQFLKSAIYYFLTDKENQKGHLKAIESILGYNEMERSNIEKNFRKV